MKNYNEKELFGMLTNLGSVTSSKWNTVREIVKSFNSVTVLEKEWADSFKKKNENYYPLDLSSIHTWSTFDNVGCIDLTFSLNESNQLICDVSIYNGDSVYGNRTNLRFKAILLLPNDFIFKISENIEWRFKNMLEAQYEIFLENKKNEWISNLEKEFMSIFNK